VQIPLTAFPPSRAKSTASLTIMIAALWAAVLIGLGAPSIKTGVFDAMSTDDAMRLVEVRDLIGGQGWFDLVQHRLDPPGIVMHWSRLIDAPLAGLILILRPLAGASGSEAITLVLWPALLFGAALLLVSAIAKRMCDDNNRRHAQLVAVLLATLSAPALIHFRTGAIDHHNAQIVLLLAFVLLTSEISQGALTAFLAGLVAMLSLAIGLEMLPAIAVACLAVFVLLIWQGGTLSRPASIFGASLAGSSFLLAAALLPIRSLQNPVCDAFGGPFLLLTAGGGVSLIVIAAVNRYQPTWRARLITGAIAGGALIGSFFKLFPGCMASPYAEVDPLLTTFWLDNVLETMSFQSILQLEPEKILGLYGFPVITLGVTIAALMRPAPHTRFRFIVPVLVLAALIGISFWAMRGAAAANIVAAPLLAASAATIWPSREQARQLVIAGLIISPVGLTGLGFAARLLIDWIIKPQSAVVLVHTPAPCQTVSGASPLSVFPSGRVMAPIDFGPAVLAATGHSVFAAPYHRNNDGNLAMVNTMLATPMAAQKILSDRQVDYVVICPGSPDQLNFVKLAPDGLAARLGRGEVPNFLEPLDLGANNSLAAWHVRK
jgi:hypothetical protein